MRFKWLLVSGLFGVGLLLLPFSYINNFHANVYESQDAIISINIAMAQNGGGRAWDVEELWLSILRQIGGVLDFTAQAIQAVTDAPGQLFEVASNNPPETQEEVQSIEPLINSEPQNLVIPAPQIYEGTLLFNVPVQITNRLTVVGGTNLADTTVEGELEVLGGGSFGGIFSAGAQFGSVIVTGNTQLNTLSVSGPVNFATLTAGSLTVNNQLSALGGIVTRGEDVNLQGGNIYAANIINEIIAGDNISIEGTASAPIISADIPSLGSRVRSLNGSSGTVVLVGGDDIAVTGLTIENTSTLDSVSARGGCTNCILDADVVDSLTIQGGLIDATVIGSTTPAQATFTTVTITDSATSTFAGTINVTSGCVAVSGVCLGGGVAQLNDLTDVTLAGVNPDDILIYDGAQWVNSDVSALGLGDGTFLGLSDTPSAYTVPGAIMFVNATSSALTQSNEFVFDGNSLSIGTSSPFDTLTVNGDIGVLGQQQIHFYDSGNSFYVGFRATSTLTSNTIWTLPATDGTAGEFLVTDGSGNFSFADLIDLGAVTSLDDLSDVSLVAPVVGDILMYNGTAWSDQATSTLGLGDGTFLGLSDTPSSYIANAISFANTLGTAITQSANFTFNGSELVVGTSSAFTTLTVAGDVSVLNHDAVRFYDNDNSNYVGLRASSTLAGNVVWTLPGVDGTSNQIMVTDGSGNLRFADVSSVGGGVTTFLALTDAPDIFLNHAIPYVATNTLAFSSDLVFNGTMMGIGTDTPTSELTVHGSVYFGFDSSTPGLVFDDVSNQVGIGTASPTERLTIEGGSVLQRGGSSGAVYAPTQTGSIDLPDNGNDVVVAGATAYVASAGTGNDFLIIDIEDRSAPSVLGSLALSAGANGVAVSGKYAYVVTTLTGNDFHVIDISNSSAPVEVASLAMPSTAFGVTVRGRYAYVTTDSVGNDFHIIDVANPLVPVEVGSLNLPTSANDVAVQGNYAYVVTDASPSGFHVIDISNPAAPTQVGTAVMPSIANDVVVRGNYAFVATASVGDDFHVIDISDPTSPTSYGSLDLVTGATGIALSGSYAYVTTAGTGDDLHVIDLTDLSAPVEVGSEELAAGAGLALRVQGRYAYVTTASTGDDFHVFDLTGVEAQTVLAHSLESGNLSVFGDMVATGNVSFSQGLRTGLDGVQSDGSLLIRGSGASYIATGLAIGTTSAAQTLTVQGSARITGSLYDSVGSAGANGSILMANGSGQVWSATSSLGLASTASLANYLPLAGGTLSGNLSFSGSAANIVLGSNWLSGDGNDEGIYIDADGNVGIGTTTPYYNFEVRGDSAADETGIAVRGDKATFLTLQSGTGTTSGSWVEFYSGATAIGYIGDNNGFQWDGVHDYVVTTGFGGNNLDLQTGFTTRLRITPGGNIGIGSSTPYAKFAITNTGSIPSFVVEDSTSPDTTPFIITATGNVGIGTSTPSSALTVGGTISASNLNGGATNLTTDANGNIIRDPSDERLKTEIVTIDDALDKVLALRGVTYQWKDVERFGTQTEIGFIAQEVDLILPEVVRKGGDYWSLNTRNIVAVVVEAIQDMWDEIVGQQEKIDSLEARVEHLESLLEVEESSAVSEPGESPVDDGSGEGQSDPPNDDETIPEVPNEEEPPTEEDAGLDQSTNDNPPIDELPNAAPEEFHDDQDTI